MTWMRQPVAVYSWRGVLNKPSFWVALILGLLAAFFAIARILPPFLDGIEARTGTRIWDPVLSLVGPYNISVLIFSATYGVSLAGLLRNIRSPYYLVWIVWTYTCINLFRMITMEWVPLEPVATIIPLRDPFLESGVYAGAPKIKDLFFSGHTATIAMFIFMERDPRIRRMLIAGTVLVAVLLLVQHVHYTVDVLGAPVFSLFCVWFVRLVLNLVVPNFRAAIAEADHEPN